MTPDHARRARRRLLLLALLFLLPPLAAYFMYFLAPGLIPKGRVNHGRLIDPARPLPATATFVAADGKTVVKPWKDLWTLVVFGAAQCDAACGHRVQLMRNLREVLRGDSKRVQIVYLAPDAESLQAAAGMLPPDIAGFRKLASGGDRLQRFFGDVDQPGGIALIDPLGNWVLAYGPQAPPKDIYVDLKRLLRFSQIG